MNMLTKRWFMALLMSGTALACLLLLPAQADRHNMPQGVVFEANAALSGDAVYRANCLACHGIEGQNGRSPALVHDRFHQEFPSESALLSYISNSMPKGNPGSLSDAEYDAVASYLMSLNKKAEAPASPPAPVPLPMSTPTPSTAAYDSVLKIVGKRIWIQGVELKLTTPPQTVNNKMMVPFRPVFTALGLSSTWDNQTKTITGQNASLTIKLMINSKEALVNDVAVPLDVAPQIRKGNTLVPLRFVAETTGLKVQFSK